MSWTKRDFLLAAYEEIGLANYIFDLQAEQLQSAVNKLDNMMLEFDAKGIKLGYPFAASPETSSIDEETNVPPYANSAIVSNLAVRLAPSVGKQLNPETKIQAYQALNMLYMMIPVPQVKIRAGVPAGAGNKLFSQPQMVFLPPTSNETLQTENNDLLFSKDK
jgi:hypothetical protein